MRSRGVSARLFGVIAALATTVVFVGGGSASPVAAAETGYVSLSSPARLLDTRPGADTADGLFAGGGTRPQGSTLELTMAGRAGVPLNATAVVVNITVTDTQGSGFVTVYPCGETRPTASNLNYTLNKTIPNLVIAKIGTNGQICIFNTAPTHVLADVAGYFPSNDALTPLAAPARLLDTRSDGATIDSQFVAGGLRPAGSVQTLQVTTRAGIPTGAATVVLNVTVDQPQAAGFITVYPCDASLPTASNLNFVANQTVPNAVIAKLSASGTICLFNSAPTHLIVDAAGYFADTTVVVPLAAPARLLDTRSDGATIDGAHQRTGRRPSTGTYQLPVAGRAGVPADASAVILNVTVDQPTAAGFITVYPTGVARPTTSNLNYVADLTVPNAVIARVGSGGTVCLFDMAATHLIVDIAGYITGPAPAAAGQTCPPDPVITTTAPSPATTTTSPGIDPQFGTCTAAKAAGYGPYYRGIDPEYSWYNDADNDGIVCE